MGAEQRLSERIQNSTAVVAVIGQGYVGLPLALCVAEAGFRTIGIDVDRERISWLNSGQSYITDVSDQAVQDALASSRFEATSEFKALESADIVIVCVPTPLSKSKDPDMSYINDAVQRLKSAAHSGMLVILESTTYPGTTDEIVAGQLAKNDFTVGTDFFACFSPERVDPGNAEYGTKNTPKVIGGVTGACLRLGAMFYREVMSSVVEVSSARVAETVKLLENTFRAVNIGLVNEMALMAERMDIDIWEVIHAASTKPFGFMPFYPGPGIGGHCIPLDPHYLAWKARSFDFNNKFIELAADINGNMPRHVVTRCAQALNSIHRPISCSKILVLGLAYKKDIGDFRESPALEVFKLLREQNAKLAYCDPFVPSIVLEKDAYAASPLTAETLGEADLVVVATDHSAFSPDLIARHGRLIVDTRNVLKGFDEPHILRLGSARRHTYDQTAVTGAVISDTPEIHVS